MKWTEWNFLKFCVSPGCWKCKCDHLYSPVFVRDSAAAVKDLMNSVWIVFERQTETRLDCCVAATLTNVKFRFCCVTLKLIFPVLLRLLLQHSDVEPPLLFIYQIGGRSKVGEKVLLAEAFMTNFSGWV